MGSPPWPSNPPAMWCRSPRDVWLGLLTPRVRSTLSSCASIYTHGSSLLIHPPTNPLYPLHTGKAQPHDQGRFPIGHPHPANAPRAVIERRGRHCSRTSSSSR